MNDITTIRSPGRCWEQPGYRFWEPGFPPGYVPTIAQKICDTRRGKAGAKSAAAKAQISKTPGTRP